VDTPDARSSPFSCIVRTTSGQRPLVVIQHEALGNHLPYLSSLTKHWKASKRSIAKNQQWVRCAALNSSYNDPRTVMDPSFWMDGRFGCHLFIRGREYARICHHNQIQCLLFHGCETSKSRTKKKLSRVKSDAGSATDAESGWVHCCSSVYTTPTDKSTMVLV